jgi:hypothetical protein
MNLVGILLAPVATQPVPLGARWGVVIAGLATLGAAVAYSKLGALATAEARLGAAAGR